jgi:hypothetical protein
LGTFVDFEGREVEFIPEPRSVTLRDLESAISAGAKPRMVKGAVIAGVISTDRSPRNKYLKTDLEALKPFDAI